MAQQLFYHPILGGEDLVSPPLSVPPERCMVALNYECDMNARLRRVDGYERFDGRPKPSGFTDPAEVAAARSAIMPVPGKGPVRGVWSYLGVKYAFRDNLTEDACMMYRATPDGWELVPTPHLPPGGRYAFDNYNFLGTAEGTKMYGANGVGPAFEFDGTSMTMIDSLSVPDTPKFVKGHKLHLMLSGMPDGQLHISGFKNPKSFNINDGAGTYGVGDYIGEAVLLPGGALGLIARNTTHILYGSSADTGDPWRIEPHSLNAGGIDYTAQHAGGMLVYLDDRGLTTLSATQRYGNFVEGTISKPVKPFYDARRKKSVCSMVCREKGQYRLFFSDGYISVASIYGGNNIGFTRMYLPTTVSCCCSVENMDGNEEMFFGDVNGYVYQMDSGNSFDGAPINGKVQLHYNTFKSTRQKKRILKAVLEIETEQETRLQFFVRHNSAYGVTVDSVNEFNITAGGGVWNESIWGEFIWLAQHIASVSAYLNGTCLSCSISIVSSAVDEKPHIIQGLTYHYIMRGLQR